jgi:hypothetical protein
MTQLSVNDVATKQKLNSIVGRKTIQRFEPDQGRQGQERSTLILDICDGENR